MRHTIIASDFVSQDYLGAAIVFACIVTALVTTKMYPEAASPSLVALAINYTLLVPIYLNWVVKLLADLEMYIGAVERISICMDPSETHDDDADGNTSELMSMKPIEICKSINCDTIHDFVFKFVLI